MVLTELIPGLFFPRSWYALGNAQINSVIFRGYYSVFGDYCVSWIVVALSELFAWYYINRTRQNLYIIVSCLTTFLVISYILSSIKYTKPYGKQITIALLQSSQFSTEDFTIDDQLAIESISF